MLLIKSLLVVAFIYSNACQAMEVVVKFPNLMTTDSCNLRGPLLVELEMEDKVVELTLTRTKGIRGNVDVFFLTNDEDGNVDCQRQETRDHPNVFMYQSVEHEAEFEVTCLEGEKPALVLEGSLELENGHEYMLTRHGDGYELIEERSALPPGGTDYSDVIHKRPTRLGKRSSTDPVIRNDIYIDTLALIHSSVYQMFYKKASGTGATKMENAKENLKRHFVHLFNGIDVRYKTASEKINIVLTGFVLEETSGRWYESVKQKQRDQTRIDGGGLLDSMIELRNSGKLPPHDHFISFTNEDMFSKDGSEVIDILGLAYLGQICAERGLPVSTVEYQNRFIDDVTVSAHEIGHSLGSEHDGEKNPCNGEANYVMAPSAGEYDSTNPFKFSTCSAKFFGKHVNSMLADSPKQASTCLHKAFQKTEVPDVNGEILGQLMDTDKQCQHAFGAQSHHCKVLEGTSKSSSICLALSCKNAKTGYCENIAAAPATTCGDKKWCVAGACVFNSTAPSADPTCVHGDQKGIIAEGKTCPQFMTSAATCNYQNNRRFCCDTCKKFDAPQPPKTTPKRKVTTPEPTEKITTTPKPTVKITTTPKPKSPKATPSWYDYYYDYWGTDGVQLG